MPLVCLTRNHTNAPLELRERLHFPEREIRSVLRELQEHAGLSECCLVCTCNRTELYFASYTGARVEEAMTALGRLADDPSISNETIDTLSEEEAIRHLFRVSGGLESAVLGENQILGQVKTAYELTCEARTSGYFINAVFHRALRVGKRIRTETELGRGCTSVAAAAVEHAHQAEGGLTGKRVLVVGTGEIAALVLRALQALSPGEICVAGRRPKRAEKLAAAHGAQGIDFDGLADALSSHDVVFSATASPGYIITPDIMGGLAPGRNLHLYDLALPRDVEPAISELDGVDVTNIDALDPQLSETMAARARAIPAAEAIVENAVVDYARWLKELAAVPSIRRLLETGTATWEREVAKLGGKLSPSEAERIKAVSRRILQNLMSGIIGELKETARQAADTHAAKDYWRLLEERPEDG